ncbi:MAG: hypothetical protein ACRDDY_03510 [Clostridium sp.]|uniref:hypothetical protein n=1 Tax=Clostridium sp. TaxID=1506 RepID=UPI003EE7FA26
MTKRQKLNKSRLKLRFFKVLTGGSWNNDTQAGLLGELKRIDEYFGSKTKDEIREIVARNSVK